MRSLYQPPSWELKANACVLSQDPRLIASGGYISLNADAPDAENIYFTLLFQLVNHAQIRAVAGA